MFSKPGIIKRNRTDLSGGHLALVVDNNDPLKLERLRVRVSEIHRGVPDDNLPWAVRVDKQSPSGDNGQVGSISIPAIGSQVWVEFHDDSAYHVFWAGTISNAATIPSALTNNYPNDYGYIDAAGNILLINTLTSVVTFTHSTGTVFSIDASGNVNVTSAQNINLNAVGDINISAGGNINLGSSGEAKISGSVVNISGEGSWPTGQVLSAQKAVTAGSLGAAGTSPAAVSAISVNVSVTPNTKPTAVDVANMTDL